MVTVYPDHLVGRRMASGAAYDKSALVAAHRTAPLGSRLVVSDGRRSVIVTVQDRGPYDAKVDLLVSAEAGRLLGLGDEPVRLDIRDESRIGASGTIDVDENRDVGQWVVQIGSFSSALSAERLAERFEGARVQEVAGPAWRVWIGGFDDRETAEAWRLRIRGWGQEGFVRRLSDDDRP